MHPRFLELAESLAPKFEALMDMQPVTYPELPKGLPRRAVYLFSEDGRPMFVGRTSNLRSRLSGHCIPSATHGSAVLAYRMAREVAGFEEPGYVTVGSRASLLTNPAFGPAFNQAKRRVAAMDIRYVEEVEPVSQELLQIYAAVVLETPYNSFETH